MRLSKHFFYTIRENSKEEESTSGNLLVRSGMVKKIGTGIYMYQPLGLRVLHNIEGIVRKHMNLAGADELLMPSLLPEEVYIASGRRAIFGSSMFTLKDRAERAYALGPTHEELFVTAAGMRIRSYKDLPFNLYQIGNKYRDEARPRYGLIRVREFIMKDAYSFDADLKGLDDSYHVMYEAYQHMFDEIGLNYKIVKADTGAMGGLLSEEFQAVTEIGEDILVLCSECDYASNIEVSVCRKQDSKTAEPHLTKSLLATPDLRKIDTLMVELGIDATHIVKTLIYEVDQKFYACLLRGDAEVNELKLSKLLNAKEVGLANFEDVKRITQAEVGFAGPIGLEIPIIIDQEILNMNNFLVGANQTGYHYQNVNLSDFSYEQVADIKNVKEGDCCPVCGGKLYFKKGIEVGNVFKLGTKYSESLGLYYSDQNNDPMPVVMGCYGIGIPRIMAALAEQKNDEKGLCWPLHVAPFPVALVLIDPEDEKQKEVAETLYQELQKEQIDVIFDDRKERPGVKFNDMDLIGIPIRLTVGKKAQEGIIEWKNRTSATVEEIAISEVMSQIKKQLHQ